MGAKNPSGNVYRRSFISPYLEELHGSINQIIKDGLFHMFWWADYSTYCSPNRFPVTKEGTIPLHLLENIIQTTEIMLRSLWCDFCFTLLSFENQNYKDMQGSTQLFICAYFYLE